MEMRDQMAPILDAITEMQWPQLLKDWHIVVALFYTPGEEESMRMLKQLETEFVPLLKDFPDTIAVKLRVQDSPDLVQSLNIGTTPTLMMFHHGEVVTRILKNPITAHQRVDRIVTPYKVLAQDLFALIVNLQRIRKK